MCTDWGFSLSFPHPCLCHLTGSRIRKAGARKRTHSLLFLRWKTGFQSGYPSPARRPRIRMCSPAHAQGTPSSGGACTLLRRHSFSRSLLQRRTSTEDPELRMLAACGLNGSGWSWAATDRAATIHATWPLKTTLDFVALFQLAVRLRAIH